MVNIFLFLAMAFLLTFLVGKLLEKIRVPWIFAALLIGSLLAIYNPFSAITSSATFEFLASLGMYFLLFIIGFEINLKKFEKNKNFIIGATLFIIFLEAIFGVLLIHYVFGHAWLVSFIVALSFATVGEAILIPILDEFKIINTKLGQSIIGVGTFDDTIEIALLIIVAIFVGSAVASSFNIIFMLTSLVALFLLTFGIVYLRKRKINVRFLSIETLFLFILSGFFLFLGIGNFANAMPLGALFAGIALKTFIPKKSMDKVKTGIRTVGYSLFAPIFFIWVGASLDLKYLVTSPLLILLIVVVSASAKLVGSWIIGRRKLGSKKTILLGIGLSIRFSTSLIIIKILFENNLIGKDLYSVIVASSIIFTFIVPVLFSNLLVKWKIVKKRKN